MNTRAHVEGRGLTGPLMMILIGVILLISRFVPDLSFRDLWPVLLIGVGAAMIFDRR